MLKSDFASPSKSPDAREPLAANVVPVSSPDAPACLIGPAPSDVRNSPRVHRERSGWLMPFAATTKPLPATVTASVNEPPDRNGEPATAASVVAAPLPLI